MNAFNYNIAPARYAKGKMVISTPSDTGYKTREARMAEAVGGKYVGRSGGYTVSPSSAQDFETLLLAGWHGSAGWFRGQKAVFSHPIHGEMPRRDAVKIARKELN